MNRAERRAAARQARKSGQHFDCGCELRVLEAVERVVCASCGAPADLPPVFEFPTAAPVGSLKTVYGMCLCGADLEFSAAVVA